MNLHTVARLDALSEDRATQVQIGDLKILLVRVADHVKAYQGECPHAGAPLAEGALCDGRIICPWHKAAFALETGALCEPPALDALKAYPVQVQDGAVRVGDQPLPSSARSQRPDARTFVVVGAGAAGTAAACALREQGFGGRLVLLDREPAAGYDRTALSKFVVAGKMPADQVPPLRDADYWALHQVERLDAEVRRIDVAGKTIELADGGHLAYDAALVATGGTPRIPALPGVDLPGVFVLRSRDQAGAILASARKGGHAVIVGDSFIGMECASALRTFGMQVTILGHSAIPFARQFGEQVGQALLDLHRRNGVSYRSDAQARACRGEGRLQVVELDNGERLSADLVLLGVGVKPVTELLSGVALAEDGGVPVDSHLRAADGLWAVGDIASFPLAGQPTRIEHWRLAQQQARLAAHNMLGGDAPFLEVPFFWTLHFEKRLDYLGHAADWQDSHIDGDLQGFNFAALLLDNDQVKAVVACQRPRLTALLAERLRRPLDRSEALALIAANR
ncbi:FAD-dependent oxidoreductase [Pseudomonas sp. HR96]|uniref:FAD-dependent oxidoreductase n=1 Tax=Pseudomonas sp. HR96 TaxID=1027966 RepID=UPI002A75EBD9|nr:FAD-dependent oxidoreductase [Pseudomonas sp. HR96]WPO97739.1 FAD-dependent oxidoreductase [Pseudomonas sp. HR96]